MTKQIGRRDFIKRVSTGILCVGAGLGGSVSISRANSSDLRIQKMKKVNYRKWPKVALVKGNDRKTIMFDALKLIEDDIKTSIGDKQVVIKPNFTREKKEDWLGATQAGVVEAMLEFLEPFYKKKVIIAEGTGSGSPIEFALENYGYFKLAEKYNVEFFDLRKDQFTTLYMLDRDLKPLPILTSNLMIDPNTYLVSASVMKTHGYGHVTLGLKNVVYAAPMNFGKGQSWRGKMHVDPFKENPKPFNYNMFLMSQYVFPDLTLIDGFVGMEGNGPLFGDPVETGVAIASTDFVAADRVGVEVMGFDFNHVGHLVYCADAKMGEGDITKINIVGDKVSNCKKNFKPHKDFEILIKWK